MVTLWKSLLFQWGKKPVLCTCTLCKNDDFCNWKIILFLDSTYKEYWCKIGMAAYSLKAGVFWRAGAAGLLYQNSNETWFGPPLLTPARYSESARNTESLKKKHWGSIQTETELSTVWSRSKCSNISTSSMMHSIKCWLAALIFLRGNKIFKTKA